MTAVSYEIRTMRDRPVFAFDSEPRAREELAKATKRVGTKLRLVKVTKLEEDVT